MKKKKNVKIGKKMENGKWKNWKKMRKNKK